MTVEEAIAQLQQFDPKDEILVEDTCCCSYVPLDTIKSQGHVGSGKVVLLGQYEDY